MIRQIAALDARRGIATESGIPWHLPGDSAYFRRQTETGAIVMGRATYEEFATPLHDRDNFVLTTTSAPLRPGFLAVSGLAQVRAARPDDDVWIVGGAGVYRETLADAAELFLTRVDGDFHCTKFFPPYEAAFALRTRDEGHRENGTTYHFETWARAGKG
jgi:dihydrofolate reductase